MKAFFDLLRTAFGPLSQNQIDGIQRLLKSTEGLTLRHRAYILATAWHETGPSDSSLHMTPRREIWGPTTAQLGYEGRADLGNTVKGDGRRFAGRGYVQITGRRNYAKASALTGRDLLANPDLALDPDIAGKIIVHGMTTGWFTGKKMADYSTYFEMRRVVNGMDRAALIAAYAETFGAALRLLPAAASKPVEPPPTPAPLPMPPEPAPARPDPVPGPSGGILGFLANLIAMIFGGRSK